MGPVPSVPTAPCLLEVVLQVKTYSLPVSTATQRLGAALQANARHSQWPIATQRPEVVLQDGAHRLPTLTATYRQKLALLETTFLLGELLAPITATAAIEPPSLDPMPN